MTLKKAEYSDLKDGDKVLLQNHNKTAGIVFFQAKIGEWICWETTEGKEVWVNIPHLKEKKTKLIGIIKD